MIVWHRLLKQSNSIYPGYINSTNCAILDACYNQNNYIITLGTDYHLIEQVTKAKPNKVISTGAQPAQRIERKFFIFPKNIGFAHTLLRQVCRLDSEYPEGLVNSLYFDTPDLDQYTRSSSGEFRKDKVRIRWYDKIEDYQGTVPVFLELKTRQGFASSKQRQRFLAPAQQLDIGYLRAGIIDKPILVDTLAGFGHYPEKPLQPVIMISYWRYRFTEMMTGVRVCLDYGIRSTFVARQLGYGERNLQLRGGVIEVKGTSWDLPLTLRRMKLLDTDWSRFSKYGYCIESHMSRPSSISRLWPSGRVIET